MTEYFNSLCDFVCLCCGGRNGEKASTCTLHKYTEAEGDLDSPEFLEGLARWLASADYKGSILVPTDFVLDEEYRSRIIEMTAGYMRTRSGIVLFGLPGVELPSHAVSLSRFLN